MPKKNEDPELQRQKVDGNLYGDGIPTEKDRRKKTSYIAWFLVILPLGIAFGTCWGLYRHFSQQEEILQKASKKITRQEIAQILHNWANVIGDRTFASQKDIDQLGLAATNLAGELQATNSGLLSKNDNAGFHQGGRAWNTLWADIKGTNGSKIFFVITSYDGKQNLRNAAKIALPITVAKSLGGAKLDYTLRFVFVPSERSLEKQVDWVSNTCLTPSETNLGMFFLAHGKPVKKDTVRDDSWKVTDGNISWAQEILKESRVMSYGIANLHHGVLNDNQPYTTKDAARVEEAAKGLRQILFLAMGGDR